MTDNPLLDFSGLPRFSQIKAQHAVPAIEQLLSENRARLGQLLEDNQTYTWDNLLQPLAGMNERLNRAWSPVRHLNSVKNSEALREAYETCLPRLSEYYTELGQNEALFQAIKSVKEHLSFALLSQAQKKIIENHLRDFRLSGVDLDSERKLRFKAIQQQLSQLKSSYENNVLDATNGWKCQLQDTQTSGLPEFVLAMGKQAAERENLPGWIFNLEFPSYHAIMTYADDRSLREQFYSAYVTRASDQGPQAGQWDNSSNMDKIMSLRQEMAHLLGFSNYAEYSLATKMAQSPRQVLDFLYEMAEKSKPVAEQDIQALKDFAATQLKLQPLEIWDVNYVSEKLRQHQYALSQQELKPYFPENRVLEGLFAIVNKLYGISIGSVTGVETWHKDVRFYEIRDKLGALRGQFYLDLYARAQKRGGAWMDECINREVEGGKIQTPVAYLTCNLTPPVGEEPALFTHDEVITLFHEFGHGLQHMLTQVDYAGVAGINGVLWDAVELPSQFMENWCWDKHALPLKARHYQTDDSLPETLYKKMRAAKNFQSGMQMLRQLEFALFDFNLHMNYRIGDSGQIQQTLDAVRNQLSVLLPPSFNRFQHTFSHIFAGGYAAGYYSYKWAEVLSADAFSLFEEQGIFNRPAGENFLHNILEMGGTEEPMELYVRFRGRQPRIDALLHHSGIA